MRPDGSSTEITLFLCGDVMTGRGIDQILPHPGKPHLYESYLHSAIEYVDLAEEENGPITRSSRPDYIWGDALDALARVDPDLRIINLETSVTTSEDAWPGKGIHYRMHPANLPCLASAGIDCCVLANNHVMDWGRAGLAETLASLRESGVATAGAGNNAIDASTPAIMEIAGKCRVLVFAWGMESSGVPQEWAAGPGRSGVNYLPDLSARSLERIVLQIRSEKQPGDLAIASMHWGDNWDFAISNAQRAFAHALIDEAGADIVHGHSSHHVKGIEVYRGKPILYGCGDLLNDYEGIHGYESFRGDLALMYFPTFNDGKLTRFLLTPTRTRRFRIGDAQDEDRQWLLQTLNRESKRFGTRISTTDEKELRLEWS